VERTTHDVAFVTFWLSANIKQTVQTCQKCVYSGLMYRHQQTIAWHCQPQMQWFCNSVYIYHSVYHSTHSCTPQARIHLPWLFPDSFQIPSLFPNHSQILTFPVFPGWWPPWKRAALSPGQDTSVDVGSVFSATSDHHIQAAYVQISG